MSVVFHCFGLSWDFAGIVVWNEFYRAFCLLSLLLSTRNLFHLRLSLFLFLSFFLSFFLHFEWDLDSERGEGCRGLHDVVIGDHSSRP